MRRAATAVTIVTGLAAAAATLGWAPAAVGAPPDPAAVQVVTLGNKYVPGDDELVVEALRVPEGGRLQLSNLDSLADHDVTDEGCRTPGQPCRFWSPSVGRDDGTVEVEGVAALAPGTYELYCTVHPSTMFGALIVEETL